VRDAATAEGSGIHASAGGARDIARRELGGRSVRGATVPAGVPRRDRGVRRRGRPLPSVPEDHARALQGRRSCGLPGTGQCER